MQDIARAFPFGHHFMQAAYRGIRGATERHAWTASVDAGTCRLPEPASAYNDALQPSASSVIWRSNRL